ncbi:hypothetical protein LguiA_026261 [Lonicera macranthoides]
MEFSKLGGVTMLLLGLGLVEDDAIGAWDKWVSKLGIYGVKIQDLGGFGWKLMDESEGYVLEMINGIFKRNIISDHCLTKKEGRLT